MSIKVINSVLAWEDSDLRIRIIGILPSCSAIQNIERSSNWPEKSLSLRIDLPNDHDVPKNILLNVDIV